MTAFADRCTQLIVDFQRAMDDNAPVTMPLMTELKTLLDLGCSAGAERDAMKAKNAIHSAAAQMAAKQAADLVTMISQIANS